MVELIGIIGARAGTLGKWRPLKPISRGHTSSPSTINVRPRRSHAPAFNKLLHLSHHYREIFLFEPSDKQRGRWEWSTFQKKSSSSRTVNLITMENTYHGGKPKPTINGRFAPTRHAGHPILFIGFDYSRVGRRQGFPPLRLTLFRELGELEGPGVQLQIHQCSVIWIISA